MEEPDRPGGSDALRHCPPTTPANHAHQISDPESRTVDQGSSRVELTWSANRKPIVPEAISVGPIHRRMHELHPWISLREASRLAGSSESLIKGGIKRGQITQRKIHRAHPSLERASVIAFLRDRRPSA